MRVISQTFSRALILVLAASLLASCGGKEERKAKYLERGKAFFTEKNFGKARIEFKNVLQIDPKTAEAFLYIGEIEEATKNWAPAFKNYKKASDLNPELVPARVHLAKFYLMQASVYREQGDEEGSANALGLAHEQVKEILAREPENLEGLTLEATLWANEGDWEKAASQLEAVVKKDPGLQAAAILLSGIYDQRERTVDAEAVLLNALANNDERAGLQNRLSAFYLRHKQNDKAEQVLREIISDNPDELGNRVSLASFLAQTGQDDKAEAVLRDAIAADPEDAQRYQLLAEYLANKKGGEVAIEELKQLISQNPGMPELKLGLIKLYVDGGQNEKARKALTGLIEDQGTNPTGIRARVLLAELIAAEGADMDKAAALVDEVLQENPSDNQALLLKAKLAISREDYESAIADLRSVLKDQPNSAEVLQLLAAVHLENGEAGLARDTLMRAVENNSSDLTLRISLAQLLAKTGDHPAALKQVDEVLGRDENHAQALAMKFELLALEGDAEGMEAVARHMQQSKPETEEGFIREARLRLAQKDYDAALVIVEKMLVTNPDSMAALIAKTDALAAQAKFAEAIPVAEKIQQLAPDSGEGYFRKGKLLEAMEDDAGATEQYKITLEKSPDSAESLKSLVNLQVKKEGPDSAEKYLLGILQDNPQHGSANDLLAMVYVMKKDFNAAGKAFERQIQITPGSALVYSQLAQTYQASDRIDDAIDTYERGLKAVPNNGQLMIGLASLREKQKDYEAAIGLYEKVLETMPGNAISMNNLAALIADHRSDEKSLETATALATQLETTNQPALLDTAGWVYYRNGNYSKAIDVLKQAVEKAPDVPVFRYHLGMAYFKKGNKESAREQLLKATGPEVVYEGVDEARSVLESL